VDELPSPDESSYPSTPEQPRKKGKGSRAGPNAADRLRASSPGSAAPAAPLPAMPDTYCESAETCALADALCLQPWIQSTLLSILLPLRFRRVLYLESNLTATARRDYDKMINEQRDEKNRMSRSESVTAPLFPHRISLAFGYEEGLAADGRALALIAKCERLSDFSVLTASAADMAQHQEYTSTTRDLRTSWDLCTNAIRQGHLLPGVSSDILIARLQLMLSRRYRCLAKEMLHGPARQEVLANTHRQLREINTYIRSFKEDLATRATALPYAEQSAFVGNRFLTLFSPSVDALLGNNTGPVPGGVTIADLPCPGGFGAPALAAPVAPAARRSLLKPAPAASFGSTPPTHLDGSPPPLPVPPQAHASQYSPWPAYPSFGYGVPPAPGPYGGYPPLPPSAGPPYQPPAQSFASPPSSAAPAARTEPRVKAEPGGDGSGPRPNAKPAARKDHNHPTTLQPQHAWITGLDCATCAPGAFMHPRCHRCPKLPFHTEPHASWDCPLRFWDVYDECPGFNRDGSRDSAQWQGENLTRAAKDAWVRLIRSADLMVPAGDGGARAPPFSS
jgi:hypothetical protein